MLPLTVSTSLAWARASTVMLPFTVSRSPYCLPDSAVTLPLTLLMSSAASAGPAPRARTSRTDSCVRFMGHLQDAARARQGFRGDDNTLRYNPHLPEVT